MSANSSAAAVAALRGVNRRGLAHTCSSSCVSRGSRKPRQSIASYSSKQSRSFASSSRSLQEVPQSHLGPLAAKDPYLYDALRPKPKSAFVALAHRLKLISHKSDLQTQQRRIQALVRACTDYSFAELRDKTQKDYGQDAEVGSGKGVIRNKEDNSEGKAILPSNLLHRTQEQIDGQYIDSLSTGSNENLAALGNTLLGLIASEFLHLRYPNLPSRVFKASLSSYVGPNTLADVASELGIAAKGIVRWDRPARKIEEMAPKERSLMARLLASQPAPNKLLSRDVHADVLRSIIAVMFQEQGLKSARTFIMTHLLSRSVSLHSLLKFNDPKRTLSHLCENLEKTHPQSRLIAETGRLSISPVFVVGVYSGKEKLGEGTGSGIRMAEFRAAEDALRRFYLSERPIEEISLPSITLDGEFSHSDKGVNSEEQKTIWNIDSDSQQVDTKVGIFQASQIGHSEVIFGSKG